MAEGKIICRRCLLEDMDEDDYVRAAKACVERYPADKRVPEDIYRSRLSICKECEYLSEGTCRKCGCFVELRALKPEQFCADVPRKW